LGEDAPPKKIWEERMLPRIPKPSNLVWSSERLLGFKVANLHSGGGSHVGCLLASVGTTEPAEATFPESNGKMAFQSGIAAGEGVDNLTREAEIFAIAPEGAGLIRRTYVGTQIGEPSEIREPGLEKGKA
jgi:hypothetical protein